MHAYPFFIELRLGYIDPKVRLTIRDVRDHFQLGSKCHRVPHMTLFGPFQFRQGYGLKNFWQIAEAITKNIYELPFTIDGWEGLQGSHGKVVAFRVVPSETLLNLRRDLSGALCPIVHSKSPWDCDGGDSWFHITLAMRLSDREYASVWKYVGGDEIERGNSASSLFTRLLSTIFQGSRKGQRNVTPLYFPGAGLRISLLNQQRILAEYDLIRQRWLSREEALSRREYSKTLAYYRKYRGLELTASRQTPGPTEFVIGDLHLGHSNIIRYCARPFSTKNVDEMDDVLIRNWNYCVKSTDQVYFLGDLAVGERTAMDYRRYLNGSIVHIQGNHDGGVPNTRKDHHLHSSGIDFRLVHDPNDAVYSSQFNGWIIHGHTHNNNLNRYPFFDPINQKINVSAEVVGYQPVSLPFLANLIRTRSDQIPTIWDSWTHCVLD